MNLIDECDTRRWFVAGESSTQELQVALKRKYPGLHVRLRLQGRPAPKGLSHSISPCSPNAISSSLSRHAYRIRLDWDGQQKKWLMTAFVKDAGPAAVNGSTSVADRAEPAPPVGQEAGPQGNPATPNTQTQAPDLLKELQDAIRNLRHAPLPCRYRLK